MTATTHDRLAPNQRLARGLKYAAVGPVDISRGVAGLGLQAAVAAGASARRRCQDAQLRRQLAEVAEKVEQALPDLLTDALPAAKSKRKCRRRPLLIAGAVVAVLAGGAVAFSVVRRSKRPEPPSPLPPSVDVAPKP